MVFTDPPPPEPSIRRMIGSRKSCAISSAISGLAEIEASAEPPRTVKSSPTTTTVRPSTLPRPNTQLAGVNCVSSPCSSYSPMPAMAPTSWKLLGSTSLSMRSRTVSRPWSRCRLTFSTPPISRANASRRARSSSSGFQVIRLLRLDRIIIIVCAYRNRFSLQPVVEDVAFGPLQKSAYRRAQRDHPRRDFLVQALLVIHRRQQADRDHDEGLVLRRPQPTGNDIAVFAKEAAVVLEAGLERLGNLRNLALHFREQRIADLDVE